MYNVFVTGINGLLGTNLTIELLNKGYRVFGLIREKSKYKGPKNDNLTLIKGSLFDDFSSLFKTMDYVIHIAAITQQNLYDYKAYKAINCQASLQIFHSASKSGVRRFIFVSSANTIGYGSLSKPGTETNSMTYPFSKSHYANSKLEAEIELLKLKSKMELIIVNPTFMIGDYDSKPSSGKIILMCWKKRIVFYPPGGKNFVHVKDVCKGIIHSMMKGKHGEKYLLANENLTYLQFFQQVNYISHQNPKMIKIPLCILRLIGYIGDILQLLHFKTNLCSSNMNALTINNYYSNKKSILKFDMKYQPVEHAISEALEYFKGHVK